MKKINRLPVNFQQGFTLIELVVVIVILGILAATAAPKFIDLTGDAKAATMKGVRAAVESATSMVHAKALVQGATAAEVTEIAINSLGVQIIAGWPINDEKTWVNIMDVSADNFLTASDGTTGQNGRIVWYPFQSTALSASAAVQQKCYVSYRESTKSFIKPDITVVTDNC